MLKILFMVLLFSFNNAHANEEAQYEVIKVISDKIEIRNYPHLKLATVRSSLQSANNNFRSLFNFISGGNSEKQKIKMTIPVFQISEKNENIMSFVLPYKFKNKELPIPDNKNIKIEELKDSKFIVLRFSGRANLTNFLEQQKILEDIIAKKKIKADLTKPIRAYYNTPWTLPFLKRNEILFRLN